MIALALPIILPVGTLLLYFAMAWVLLWQLARTGDRAFAWLIAALVIWPSIGWASNGAAIAAFRGSARASHVFPYSLDGLLGVTTAGMYGIIEVMHRLIGSALLFVAIWSLCRVKIQPKLRQAA
jgi:hypothetical protein